MSVLFMSDEELIAHLNQHIARLIDDRRVLTDALEQIAFIAEAIDRGDDDAVPSQYRGMTVADIYNHARAAFKRLAK